jgi:hypothetical protein
MCQGERERTACLLSLLAQPGWFSFESVPIRQARARLSETTKIELGSSIESLLVSGDAGGEIVPACRTRFDETLPANQVWRANSIEKPRGRHLTRVVPFQLTA